MHLCVRQNANDNIIHKFHFRCDNWKILSGKLVWYGGWKNRPKLLFTSDSIVQEIISHFFPSHPRALRWRKYAGNIRPNTKKEKKFFVFVKVNFVIVCLKFFRCFGYRSNSHFLKLSHHTIHEFVIFQFIFSWMKRGKKTQQTNKEILCWKVESLMHSTELKNRKKKIQREKILFKNEIFQLFVFSFERTSMFFF